MDSTELHRATAYRVLIRIGQELQLSVKMGHFLIRSIRTPAVRAEYDAGTGNAGQYQVSVVGDIAVMLAEPWLQDAPRNAPRMTASV